jgi:hypothetical protein
LAICFSTAVSSFCLQEQFGFGHFDATFDNIPFTLYCINVRTGHCGHVAPHDLKVNYHLDLFVRMFGQFHSLFLLLSEVTQGYTRSLVMALIPRTKF